MSHNRGAVKGYHARAVLKDLDGGVWKTRIAEPQRKGFSRWHGDEDARTAVYANRNRLRSEVGKAGMRKRAELVERSFAHNLERGGMRRTWLRGRENVHKRYLIHVAGPTHRAYDQLHPGRLRQAHRPPPAPRSPAGPSNTPAQGVPHARQRPSSVSP